MAKKQIQHLVICPECNTEYVILTAAYDKRVKNGNINLPCKSCNQKKIWKALTKTRHNKRCISQKERWARLSDDNKERIMCETRKAQLDYCRNPKNKLLLAERNHNKWNNLSKEEKQLELNRLNKIRMDYWNSLSEEDKYLKMKKMWDCQTNIGPTEHAFNEYLQIKGLIKGINYDWQYNTFPYIHPEYYNRFGITNDITGEMNFPYHSWDFIIHSRNGNSMVIDIDGSAHDKNSMQFIRAGNSFTEREKIDYNDSQRSYQIPPGIDAYVVECYNDKLTDETIVWDISTGKKISYKDFEFMIFFSQTTSKELKKIIKLI